MALANLRDRLLKTRFIEDVFAGDEAYGASIPFAKALVEHWRYRSGWRALETRIMQGPYIETGIEFFGAARRMFGSNFPVDGIAADTAVVWNAFKHISKGLPTTRRPRCLPTRPRASTE